MILVQKQKSVATFLQLKTNFHQRQSKMSFGAVIWFAFALFAASEGVKLECEYGNVDCSFVGVQYSCNPGKVIQTGNERSVTEVSGNHQSGKLWSMYSNSDVECVGISNDKSLKFLPRNMSIHFPNLIAFSVVNCSIEEVSHADLADLPNLRMLWLSGNNIKIIPSNLFASNPALVLISLHSNPIANVGYGVFDHLKNLEELSLDRTTCIAEQTTVYQARNVSSMTRKIYENCPPIYESIKYLQEKVESQQNGTENLQNAIIELMRTNIQLEASFKENRVEIMSVQKVNGELRNQIIQIDWKIKKIEEELRRPMKCKCET